MFNCILSPKFYDGIPSRKLGNNEFKLKKKKEFTIKFSFMAHVKNIAIL